MKYKNKFLFVNRLLFLFFLEEKNGSFNSFLVILNLNRIENDSNFFTLYIMNDE
jgi:hypothetical protein